MKKIISVLLLLCAFLLTSCTSGNAGASSEPTVPPFERVPPDEYEFIGNELMREGSYVIKMYSGGELNFIALFLEENGTYTELVYLGVASDWPSNLPVFFEGDQLYVVGYQLVHYDLKSHTPQEALSSVNILPFEMDKLRLLAYDDEYIYVSARIYEGMAIEKAEVANYRVARDGTGYEELAGESIPLLLLDEHGPYSLWQYMDEAKTEHIGCFTKSGEEATLLFTLSDYTAGWFFENNHLYSVSDCFLLDYDLHAYDSLTSYPIFTCVAPQDYEITELIQYDDEMIYVAVHKIIEPEAPTEYFAAKRNGSGYNMIAYDELPK